MLKFGELYFTFLISIIHFINPFDISVSSVNKMRAQLSKSRSRDDYVMHFPGPVENKWRSKRGCSRIYIWHCSRVGISHHFASTVRLKTLWTWLPIHYYSVIYKILITKTCLYNFDPLKLHFYIVKLGFTGVYIIFLISSQKHRLCVLVRTASPRRF